MIILKNLTLSDGSIQDIRIDAGQIVEIGRIADSGTDCTDLIGLAGFVDPHTHLREPGFEASETVLSGSKAAAAGGYTAICAMANTEPVADNSTVIERVYDLGIEAGLCFVQPIGAVTKGLKGLELANIQDMSRSRAKVAMFSDDGMCVHDENLMRQALLEVKKFGGVVAQHAQEPSLTIGAQMNQGAVATELGLTGWPAIAEEQIIARDAQLAQETGSRLHICHLTTGGGVEVVRWAKAKGIQITAEVTPHHLLLTENLVRTYDPVYKVNPPLRTTDDNRALLAGLVDGTIDMLGTDHAPHSGEKKDCEWENAAFGMIGLESAASILHQVLIQSGAGDWTLFENIISKSPAKLTGLNNHGSIEVGAQANITVFNPHERIGVAEMNQSKSSNNPYLGLEFIGRVQHTIYQGQFTMIDQSVRDQK
ncbi:dihydroorotase [Aquiluna sp. Uisw_065]|uniref:dihydroorotase n=1 Tax=Aquiluna sp. Uisw_065 TaxID=3230967 RepID=UPI0039EA0E50